MPWTTTRGCRMLRGLLGDDGLFSDEACDTTARDGRTSSTCAGGAKVSPSLSSFVNIKSDPYPQSPTLERAPSLSLLPPPSRLTLSHRRQLARGGIDMRPRPSTVITLHGLPPSPRAGNTSELRDGSPRGCTEAQEPALRTQACGTILSPWPASQCTRRRGGQGGSHSSFDALSDAL